MSNKEPEEVTVDLNLWRGHKVTLTIKNTSINVQTNKGSSKMPFTIDGIFIYFDGEYVHLNDHTDNIQEVTCSLRAEDILLVEMSTQQIEEVPAPDGSLVN